MMRVVIWTQGFQDWNGGIDFLRTVISSLQHADPSIEIHLAVPSRGPVLVLRRVARNVRRVMLRALRGDGPIAAQPSLDHVWELATGALAPVRLHEIDFGAAALANLTRRLQASVVVPAFVPLARSFPVPWVGYIADFQHRHLPTLFTPSERDRRDRHFDRMLTGARAVIVNARAVAADALAFLPTAKARVFPLPFSAAPQPDWLGDTWSVNVQYGIGSHYFIVCNQFWKHKDHRTAFEAFAAIAADRTDVELVCTGATHDYRDPAHFGMLREFLTDLGVAHRVRVLGVIPKCDQIALVRRAVALLQPTLFEGGPGGGAVFDAVSLGVPCLVSSIPVNLELEEPGVQFFAPGDVSGLAQLMRAALESDPRPLHSNDSLLARGAVRRKTCGKKILDAVAWATAA